MNIVIKHCKTIAEFKQLEAYLKKRAVECYLQHKKTFGNWKFGEIEKVWIDEDGNTCIMYASGDWWHYNDACEWW